MKLQTKLIGPALLVVALCAPTAVAAHRPPIKAPTSMSLSPTAPEIRQTDPRAAGPVASAHRQPIARTLSRPLHGTLPHE